MTDLEYEVSGSASGREKHTSTSYSNNISCGICKTPVRNVPVMYERINIEWRCMKCLRRDKPTLEEHSV